MTPDELIREREHVSRLLHGKLTEKVRRAERTLYEKILDMLSGMDTDADGNIKRTAKNRRMQTRIDRLYDRFVQTVKISVVPWLIKAVRRLLGLNRTYFDVLRPHLEESVHDRAVERTLEAFGYNMRTRKIIPGGYLSRLTNAAPAKDTLMGRITSALLGKMELRVFTKTFRVEAAKGGIIGKFWERAARALFQQIDRTAQDIYREQLKLRYAIYSGTIMKRTRNFCRRRVNRVYTLEEINSWNEQKWQGKIPGVDVKVALGGYGPCRHHLSWITGEYALIVGEERGGIDKYNPI